MSKSIGNTIDPFELTSKYNSDYIRYFLLRETHFGNDGNFSHENLQQRITSELINNIGNLCQRTFTLLHKNCNGIVPECHTSHPILNKNLINEIKKPINEFKFNHALDIIIQYSSQANEFIQEAKPWDLFKHSKQIEGESVLHILLYAIFQIKEALSPVIPDFYEKISTVFQNQPFQKGIQLQKIDKVFQPCT